MCTVAFFNVKFVMIYQFHSKYYPTYIANLVHICWIILYQWKEVINTSIKVHKKNLGAESMTVKHSHHLTI